ncbi:hypothetical protein pb186bvf_000375 [Paramecium bursaria]
MKNYFQIKISILKSLSIFNNDPQNEIQNLHLKQLKVCEQLIILFSLTPQSKAYQTNVSIYEFLPHQILINQYYNNLAMTQQFLLYTIAGPISKKRKKS